MPLFRTDRIASLYIARPLKRLAPGGAPSVTILMYHGVRKENYRNGDHPYHQMSVEPEIFRMQMSFLSSQEYRVVPLADIDTWIDGDRSADGKTVVLTFDDGFRDFYFNAFPILREKGFPVSMFLPTGLMGGTRNGVEHLRWEEVRELSSGGIAFGSHTVNHPKLHGMAFPDIEREIRDSRREIEERIGTAVDTFAYPSAFPQEDSEFISRLGEILGGNGIRFGVTSAIGRVSRNRHPLFLRRIQVNSHDDIRLFRAKLEGAYDWLQVVQYASRRISGWKRKFARN